MKGYGLASWLKKEEYKNYFVTANYKGDSPEKMCIRLHKLNNQAPNGHEVLAAANMGNLCK